MTFGSEMAHAQEVDGIIPEPPTDWQNLFDIFNNQLDPPSDWQNFHDVMCNPRPEPPVLEDWLAFSGLVEIICYYLFIQKCKITAHCFRYIDISYKET